MKPTLHQKNHPEITSLKVKILWDSGLFYCPYIPDILDNTIREFIAKSGMKTRNREIEND